MRQDPPQKRGRLTKVFPSTQGLFYKHAHNLIRPVSDTDGGNLDPRGLLNLAGNSAENLKEDLPSEMRNNHKVRKITDHRTPYKRKK